MTDFGRFFRILLHRPEHTGRSSLAFLETPSLQAHTQLHIAERTTMDTTRRDFLGEVAANAAVLGAMPLSLAFSSLTAPAATAQQGEKWDVAWVNRLTGKHKAIFDVPEVESG